VAIDLGELRCDLCRGESPWKVGKVLRKPCRRCVEGERADSVWKSGGEEDADRTTFARPHEHGAISTYRIDHGTQVVDPLFEGEDVAGWVGEASTASVPHGELGRFGNDVNESLVKTVGFVNGVDIADNPSRRPDHDPARVTEHTVCKSYVAVARVVHPSVAHVNMVAFRRSTHSQFACHGMNTRPNGGSDTRAPGSSVLT
jgi:hypothetical protein